jgi:radical SAM superfamily enzyme YgiQ (UPF0313 family)
VAKAKKRLLPDDDAVNSGNERQCGPTRMKAYPRSAGMKALLINPRPDFCIFTFTDTLWLTGKKLFGPPLGLITAAAMLPGDWNLRVVDSGIRPVSEDQWQWADMVMLSGNFLHRQNLLELVREAKQRGKPVAVGGPFATSLSEQVLDAGADFVVLGEGENTIPLFLESLEAGEKKGVFRGVDRPDMATSPVPRFDLLSDRNSYQYLQIQTARGCPFNCEFCDVINLHGRVPRYKSPDQVIEELEALYCLGWRGPVFVADDNFIGNKKHARDTLEQMIHWQEKRGKPFGFITQVSVNLGQDREMIDLMTAARFGDLLIGVESPDEDVLKIMHKNQNIANPLADSLINIIKNGLQVVGSFVVGFDGETRGVGQRISAFVEKTAIPLGLVNTLWAYPNTSLWHRLKQEGRLLEAAPTSQDFLTGIMNFVPSRPKDEVVEDFVETWDYLYEPSRFLARVYRYYLMMRPTRKALAEKEGTKVSEKRASRTLRDALYDMRGAIILFWIFGIRSGHRLQFWKQFVGMLRQNPSRLKQYLIECARGLDLFRIRDLLRSSRESARRESVSSAA